MTTALSLDVQLREVVGKKVKYLRQNGIVPATVYGKGFDALSVQIDDRKFNTIYQKVGRTALVNLQIPGQSLQAAFIQEVQRHPVSRTIIHADFRVVNLKEAMTVEVPIVLVGTSPVIVRGDALLNQSLATLSVHALPADLPQHIEVDVSVLTRMDKSLHVRDILKNPAYTCLTSEDTLVVSLTSTRLARGDADEEEVETTTSLVPDSSEPQLIRKDRQKEGNEG